MQTVVHKIRHLRDVGNKLLAETDWKVLVMGSCLIMYALTLAYFYNVQRTLSSFQVKAVALEQEVKDLNEKLGHRFAYVTADMDSAKTQIRGISDGLERLNVNAAKVVKYLESKDRGKNARQK